MPKTAGALAQLGQQKKAALGDFKLIASMWSPSPWLKRSSGRSVHRPARSAAARRTPWPFVWNAQFAGGVLDTSGSAARRIRRRRARRQRSDQRAHAVRAHAGRVRARLSASTSASKLYAISLQNELGFEEYYGSCAYPRASDYIAVLKAARAELDRYEDLRAIRILGPRT